MAKANNKNRAKASKKGGGGPKATKGGDARLKIIARNRGKVRDARDKLVSLNHASGVDARAKLTKIRNLKKGMLEQKTTAGGAITITKTTQGKTVLTTKKRTKASSNGASSSSSPAKNVTKTVGRGGAITLKTKNKVRATLTGVARANQARAGQAGAAHGSRRGPAAASSQSGTAASRKRPVAAAGRSLTRTIKGEMSEAARLDMELMNTRVDPVILKRTVNNHDAGRQARPRMSSRRSASPLYPVRRDDNDIAGRMRTPSPLYTRNRMRSRSRSPLDVDMYESRRRPTSQYHYDDPRRMEMESSESFMRRHEQRSDPAPRTMADRYESHVSPLEGAKVVVTNLQNSVTKDDIVELFGDVGALKRAKVSTPGTAEVVFVNRSDAQKAVEIYHNRQLDGKAMKCQIVGAGGMEAPAASNSSYRLPASSDRGRRGSGGGVSQVPPVEINRALFDERKQGRGRPAEDESRYRRRSDENRSRRY